MIALSILVPSVVSRWDNFGLAIQDQLFGQWSRLSPTDQALVEILVLTDTKHMNLGTKRNNLVRMAQGTYVAFVDDDDRLAGDYLSALLSAAESGADVITFDVSVSLDGAPPKLCQYSIRNSRDYNTAHTYQRLPNHLMAIKREHALWAPFPIKTFGEDSDFAKAVRPFLKTQHRIDRVLYHYDYNSQTTETQGANRG